MHNHDIAVGVQGFPRAREGDWFEMLGLWCCIGFIALFFVSMWPLAGFLPPPSPSLAPEQLMVRFADHIGFVHAAMPVGMIAGTLAIPWAVTLALQVARIDPRARFLALACLTGGVVDAMLFILEFIIWGAAFYRPDRSPELVRILNDMGWLEMVLAFGPWIVQTGSVALAGLMYRGAAPLFPRWFCFMSLWACLLVMPGAVGIFFYSGPFSWSGVIVFWLPVAAFGVYYMAALPVVYRAIKTPESCTPDDAVAGVSAAT